MYYERSRRRSSPRRILLLLILVGVGVLLIANQNDLRQQVIPPPTPTATRTANSYVVEAESSAQTGNLKAATQAYIQAIALDPENLNVLVTLARIMALTDSTAEGVKWAERADPNYAEGQADLAEIYAEVGDGENAQISIQKALALAPNRSEVRRAQGTVLESQGKFTDAAEAYRHAVQAAPNVAYLYLVLGQAYRTIASVRDASLWPSALEAFKKGTEVDPTDVRLWDELGWSHYYLDQYRDAQEILEKAITIDPQAWSPRSHLAATYFQRTQYEDAIATFKQALDLMNQTFDADHYCVTGKTPSCDRLVMAYSTLGYAYRQLGQCAPNGLGAFRKALIVRPADPTAQLGFNQCAEDLGTRIPRTPTPRP